jgi:hypothetical protein
VPVTAIATAMSDGSKGASKSGQTARLRQLEQKRLRALVDADVAGPPERSRLCGGF